MLHTSDPSSLCRWASGARLLLRQPPAHDQLGPVGERSGRGPTARGADQSLGRGRVGRQVERRHRPQPRVLDRQTPPRTRLPRDRGASGRQEVGPPVFHFHAPRPRILTFLPTFFTFSPDPLPPGRWHFLGLSIKGDQATVLVDCRPLASRTLDRAADHSLSPGESGRILALRDNHGLIGFHEVRSPILTKVLFIPCSTTRSGASSSYSSD
ncbi:unnamed protein product [Protopolystoma xenopodis]|uniref:Laminin G domain-containing protein n=1 Tax=Protopolystoma xenopodis TaxID=117903 RepID=A0A448XHJ3_9PLAT|nr:unnamed protein product [Protopolystoma xenopodis]